MNGNQLREGELGKRRGMVRIGKGERWEGLERQGEEQDEMEREAGLEEEERWWMKKGRRDEEGGSEVMGT